MAFIETCKDDWADYRAMKKSQIKKGEDRELTSEIVSAIESKGWNVEWSGGEVEIYYTDQKSPCLSVINDLDKIKEEVKECLDSEKSALEWHKNRGDYYVALIEVRVDALECLNNALDKF